MNEYPAWRYGAAAEGELLDGKPAFEHNGKWVFKKLCKSADDVPNGFVDSPEKVSGEAPKKRGRPPAKKLDLEDSQIDIEGGDGE